MGFCSVYTTQPRDSSSLDYLKSYLESTSRLPIQEFSGSRCTLVIRFVFYIITKETEPLSQTQIV